MGKAGAKALTKGALCDAIAASTELKKSQCSKVLDSLASLASKEVKKTGKVIVPGVCMIKTRLKPATKAGKREMFGKVVVVKAKPAKTIVKAIPVAALKKSVWGVSSCSFLLPGPVGDPLAWHVGLGGAARHARIRCTSHARAS